MIGVNESITMESRGEPQALAGFTGDIVLVGAGQMGGALLRGWLAQGLPSGCITISDPNPPASTQALINAYGLGCNPPIPRPADIVFLAIKPQIADGVMPLVRDFIGPSTAVVSIMAGKTMRRIEDVLGSRTAIVRTIPNTPAAIGRSVTGAAANDRVSVNQRLAVEQLLAAVGKVEWLASEDLVDVLGAVSGSGPAYVFLLVEALAQAGAVAGLPPDLSARIARATVEGAGELMYRSPEIEPAVLRQYVTSPNGATQAALHVLTVTHGIEEAFVAAVAAAIRRSRELAGE